jgi:hypothetical protein
MEPVIEGTATFKRVEIQPKPDEKSIEVYGHYEDSVTGYSATQVEIEGLIVLPEGSGSITIEKPPSADDQFIWVTAENATLRIETDKPEGLTS